MELAASQAGRLNTPVREIAKEGRRVTGVVLDDGTVLPAGHVVCNMEVIPAYKHLLKEDDRFMKKLERFAPACSGIVLHLGTDRIYPVIFRIHRDFGSSAGLPGNALYLYEALVNFGHFLRE